MHRKVLLRRRLIRWAKAGPVYVPFIGDGDIANQLYRDRVVFGADLDPDRVEVASGRFPKGNIVVEDCDNWPFPGVDERFALADFDAYASPYPSFRAFWENAEKCDTIVVFFTDGHYQAAQRTGWWYPPDGSEKRWLPLGPGSERMKLTWQYLNRYVWPWFDEYIQPYRVVQRWRYRRMHVMYWGAALKVPKTRG